VEASVHLPVPHRTNVVPFAPTLLPADAQVVLGHVDGRTTVRELVERCGLSFEKTLTAIRALEVRGLVWVER